MSDERSLEKSQGQRTSDLNVDSESPTQVDQTRQPQPIPSVAILGYARVRPLHQGGQGIVYEALQQSTKRMVAIKVLHGGVYAAEAAKKRFQREVEIVAKLKHPNIVSIFDSGQTSAGLPYYVMEYVDGFRLDRFVRERELTLEEVLRLYLPILDAVGYAHREGVIHRDLKPSNILVDREGRPRVVDFGLARTVLGPGDSVASATGQVLGTFAYMSPEQVRGKSDQIDERTDVYALGMILYEICTGKSPYPVDSEIVEVLRHITETPPVLPVKAWDSTKGITLRTRQQRQAPIRCPIDADLETVILKTLAKEKERRYASTRELAQDLRRHLEGEPIAARRDSNLYLLKRKVKRYRGSILVVAVALIIFVAALVMMQSRGPRTTPIDEQSRARFLAAESGFLTVRQELASDLEQQRTSGDLVVDPLTSEGLGIIQDAINELRSALDRDPGNQALQDLLLKNYQREIELMKKVCALPTEG